MKVTRPDFCTTVGIDEYDYVGQFDRAMKEGNRFHKKMQKDCPPPYVMLDAGKVYGLLVAIDELNEKVAELEYKLQSTNK
jgi:hypothetical protein